jgi:hypothetical protein
MLTSEPTVAEMLALWCRVETAAFEAEDAARKEASKPAVNVVTIATARTAAEYKVTPFATSWGRGFTLQKIGGKKPESYDVLIGVRGEPDCCDCGAATFSAHRPCKHVLACRKLVAEGMPVPASKPANTARDLANDAAYRW